MKRMTMQRLKRVLREGDYVGVSKETFQKVLSIHEEFFLCVNHAGEYKHDWLSSQAMFGGLYWLPGELLKSTEIKKIQQTRK